MCFPLLVVLTAFPVEVVERPDGKVAQPVAQVLMGDGEVTIAGKTTFPPKRGTLLARTDKLEVKGGAWVALVLLENQYVVRLDDELEVEVGKLALFAAPKRTQAWADQLDAMLTRQEKEKKQRLIGWNVSLAAASTPGAAPERERRRDRKEEGEVAVSLPTSSPPGALSPKPAPRAQAPAPAPPPPSPEPASIAELMPARSDEKFIKAAPSPSGGMIPRDELSLLPDAELTQCLDDAVTALGVKRALGRGLLVEAKVRDGRVVVRVERGVGTPACALSWFVARQALLEGEWAAVQVPLK